MSRNKNLSPLPCRWDVLTRGLAHCLRAHSLSLRDNIGKKLAYAKLTHREMLKNYTPPQVLLTPALVFTVKYVGSTSVVRMKKSYIKVEA